MILPGYLIKKIPKKRNIEILRSVLPDGSIQTVCESAKCPNIGECYSRKTLTFMIMGKNCTRACRFCAVASGTPEKVDPAEPEKIARAACALGLNYVVVTSVTRDDLSDGGAEQFVRVIKALAGRTTEVLIPDFGGNWQALDLVVAAGPAVINHNVETVPRLYPEIRPQPPIGPARPCLPAGTAAGGSGRADFNRSLELLFKIKSAAPHICVKSGFMVGLGEEDGEIINLIKDLKDVKCDVVTIGQYFPPSKDHPPVKRWVDPALFEKFKKFGEGIGVPHVEAGPLVRSSFNAEKIWKKLNDCRTCRPMFSPSSTV